MVRGGLESGRRKEYGVVEGMNQGRREIDKHKEETDGEGSTASVRTSLYGRE